MSLIFGDMDALAAFTTIAAVVLLGAGLAGWAKVSPWLAFVAWCAAWLIMHFGVPAAIEAQLKLENSYNSAEVVSNGLPFWFLPVKWFMVGLIVLALIMAFVKPGPLRIGQDDEE